MRELGREKMAGICYETERIVFEILEDFQTLENSTAK